MALNLNVSPYYDDFDDTKNFNRVLFRPGYAVQARELTQLQTLLQSQIGKFGNHIFKNGFLFSLIMERINLPRLPPANQGNTPMAVLCLLWEAN